MSTGRYITVRILAVMLSAGIVSSCVKTDVSPVGDNAPITYQAVIGLAAKSGTDGAVYPTDGTFRTVAYYNEPGSLQRNASTEWVPASTVRHFGTYWNTVGAGGAEAAYNWPLAGSLTFLAYSPADIAMGSGAKKVTMDRNGFSLTGWDSESADCKGIDFMVADLQKGKNANEFNGGWTGVPMVFRHMLTKIKVTVARSNDRDVKVNYIQFENIHTRGDYSATMAGTEWGGLFHRWTVDETSSDGVLRFVPDAYRQWENAGETTSELHVLDGYYAIPQDIASDAVIVINYDDSTVSGTQTQSEYLSVFHEKWERGIQVHYRIIIGAKKEIRFEGSADEWSDQYEAGGAGL